MFNYRTLRVEFDSLIIGEVDCKVVFFFFALVK